MSNDIGLTTKTWANREVYSTHLVIDNIIVQQKPAKTVRTGRLKYCTQAAFKFSIEANQAINSPFLATLPLIYSFLEAFFCSGYHI